MIQCIPLNKPTDWKAAVVGRLREHNMTRYVFVRKAVSNELCGQHTAECLLASDTSATGQRIPTLETAINLARLAGFDLVLVPTREPCAPN